MIGHKTTIEVVQWAGVVWVHITSTSVLVNVEILEDIPVLDGRQDECVGLEEEQI